ncbi:hypothetical protein MKX03_020600, partial [Papaver bracteatum]
DSHSQRQENASDSGEVAKRPETSQDLPSEVVKPSSTSGSDASEVLNGATN